MFANVFIILDGLANHIFLTTGVPENYTLFKNLYDIQMQYNDNTAIYGYLKCCVAPLVTLIGNSLRFDTFWI